MLNQPVFLFSIICLTQTQTCTQSHFDCELWERWAPGAGRGESWLQNTLPAAFKRVSFQENEGMKNSTNPARKQEKRKHEFTHTHPNTHGAPTHFNPHTHTHPPLYFSLAIPSCASSCPEDCQQWSHYVLSLSVIRGLGGLQPQNRAQLQTWSSISEPSHPPFPSPTPQLYNESRKGRERTNEPPTAVFITTEHPPHHHHPSPLPTWFYFLFFCACETFTWGFKGNFRPQIRKHEDWIGHNKCLKDELKQT